MQINFTEAEVYLACLNFNENTKFNFTAFHDKGDSAFSPFTYYNTFENVKNQLAEHNRNGYGVFVAINEFKGPERRKVNIKSVRAIWQEDDDGFGDTAFDILGIEPTIVVNTSPGKFHRIFI